VCVCVTINTSRPCNRKTCCYNVYCQLFRCNSRHNLGLRPAGSFDSTADPLDCHCDGSEKQMQKIVRYVVHRTCTQRMVYSH